MGVRIRGTLGDIDPLKKAPFKESHNVGFRRVPFKGVSRVLPRILWTCLEIRRPPYCNSQYRGLND